MNPDDATSSQSRGRLEVDSASPIAATDGAQREIAATSLFRRPPAAPSTGAYVPILVTPLRRSNMIACAAMGTFAVPMRTAPLLAQERNDATRGIQPEKRAAREHDRIEALDRHFRLEQRRIAAARSPPERYARSHVRLIEYDSCNATQHALVVRVPDSQTRTVRNQIAKPGTTAPTPRPMSPARFPRSPAAHRSKLAILPRMGATRTCSIFIASITAIRCPLSRSVPSSTKLHHTAVEWRTNVPSAVAFVRGTDVINRPGDLCLPQVMEYEHALSIVDGLSVDLIALDWTRLARQRDAWTASVPQDLDGGFLAFHHDVERMATRLAQLECVESRPR